MPPPPPVEGWDGDGVRELAIQVGFDLPLATLDIEREIEDAIEVMGIDESGSAVAVFEITLEGSPLSDVYGQFGVCHNGARLSGTIRLVDPDHPTVSSVVDFRLPTPNFLFGWQCRDDPDDAPYVEAFRPMLTEALADIWGPAAVPYLISVLDGVVENSGQDYPHWAAAMDAFRRLDDEAISEDDTRIFLRRVIAVVQELVESGNSPHGADVAARRVLEAYAGVNHGVATEDDVDQWQEWLSGWDGP